MEENVRNDKIDTPFLVGKYVLSRYNISRYAIYYCVRYILLIGINCSGIVVFFDLTILLHAMKCTIKYCMASCEIKSLVLYDVFDQKLLNSAK